MVNSIPQEWGQYISIFQNSSESHLVQSNDFDLYILNGWTLAPNFILNSSFAVSHFLCEGDIFLQEVPMILFSIE